MTTSPNSAQKLQTQIRAHTGERELVARVITGDVSACEDFVARFGGMMLAVARRFMRCDHDAADAVQEAFLSAFRSIERFEGQSGLGTWLHRIVVNACLMKLRTAKTRQTVSIESLLPAFDETGHHAQPIRDWEMSPSELFDNAQLRSHVRSCINRLPDTHRNVLLLRDIEGLDTEEAAARLGISTSAVKVRLHRARLALRTLLDPIMSESEF
ncbi:MAG: sigma-70 family RNA polymerase sigma factor [Planctomycetes bacterium]|nr:sigma-70 family RNA polymerase sigma factor [Planctomycetota bacterium]